jgi:hypothetical protein
MDLKIRPTDALLGRWFTNRSFAIKYIDKLNIDGVDINDHQQLHKYLKIPNIFKNPLLLWLIFNCRPTSIKKMLMLKDKFIPRLDINQPSSYGELLSPLQASILKGRNRICENKDDQKSLSDVIDMLIGDPDIDLSYKDILGYDALAYSLLTFDTETVRQIIDKLGGIPESHKKFYRIHTNYYFDVKTKYLKFVNKLVEKLVNKYQVIDSKYAEENLNNITDILQNTTTINVTDELPIYFKYSINDLCTVLKQDYDINILGRQSTDIQHIFNKVATRGYKEIKSDNQLIENNPENALIKLIYNYYNSPSLTTLTTGKQIFGPYTLTYHYSKQYDMKIYMFGETHIGSNDCSGPNTHIAEFLKLMFEKTSVFIDFYSEDNIFQKSDKKRDTRTLSVVDKTFRECFNPVMRKKGLCKYPGVRFHSTDIRAIKYGLYQKQHDLQNLINFVNKIYSASKLPGGSKFIQRMKPTLFLEFISTANIRNKLTNIKTKSDMVELLTKVALEIPILQKEIKRSYLQDAVILKAWKKTVNRVFFKTRIRKNIIKINWNSFDTYFKEYNKIYISLILFQASLMDLYAITRLFKRFCPPTRVRCPTPIQRNIITYQGDGHSDTQRFMLKQLGFDEIFNISSNHNTCLDLSGYSIDFKI